MVTHQKPVLRLQKHPCSPRAQQVAKAVNNATEQSLVLIDEFGKGTNTVRRRMRTGMEDEGTGEENSGKGRGWMGRGGGVGQGRARTEEHGCPGSVPLPLPSGRWTGWHFWLLCSGTG